MKYKTYRNNWLEISSGFHKWALKVSPASYFDGRIMIHFSFLYGSVFIHLPFGSGVEECEYPQYGFYFYGEGTKWFDSFWILWGRKIKCIHMPWSWDWVRTSKLKKDYTWAHDVKGDRKEFWREEWEDILWAEDHEYTYILKSGEVQKRIATIKVEEMEWRWRAFKWLKWPAMIRKSIDVRFSDEVGERTGTWKGGTLGCGYEIKSGESPLECLRRMEKEMKF